MGSLFCPEWGRGRIRRDSIALEESLSPFGGGASDEPDHGLRCAPPVAIGLGPSGPPRLVPMHRGSAVSADFLDVGLEARPQFGDPPPPPGSRLTACAYAIRSRERSPE